MKTADLLAHRYANDSPPLPPRRRAIPRHKFGPIAVEVANFLAYADVPGSTIDLLKEIDRRWPALSFRDFWGAYVLADSMAWKIEGNA